MSKKTKVVGLALVAVLAFSAFAASAAQAGAPRWKVAGAFLGTGATKVIAGTGGAAGTNNTLGVPGLLSLETAAGANCTFTGNIIGTAANTPGTATGHLHCTNVKVEGNPNCVVTSDPGSGVAGTVLTNSLTGTLVWLNATNTTSVGITFKPESGTTFTTITIENCAVEGDYTISGNVISSVTSIEATEGTLVSTGGANPPYWTNQTPVANRVKDEDPGLTFGTKASTLMAGFTVKLNPCALYGIFNG